ncbi:MAG: 23S rRNA (uracil(1939)-C(5))-methyltransferase RlmD [Lachnospiraceae bacterium]|nr:23S rRNA (uracil(1939)-C(5))-methyltransferase RlmD [Lachnospiraceae bacterium]
MERPVYKKNDRLEVAITDMGMDGEGIGKVDGFTVFVKDALIGDIVSVKLMKVKKNYAYGKLQEIIRPAASRVEPLCFCASSCGGCQIQSMAYDAQLLFKEQKVKNDLRRIGEFGEDTLGRVFLPIIGMDEPKRYRNKAQYPIGSDREGNLIAGFYAGRTHSIIPNTDCLLGADCNGKILKCILEFAGRYHIPAYDEETRKGLLRHVLIRQGFSTGEVMICLVINGNTIPNAEELTKSLCTLALPTDHPESCFTEWKITSISVSPNTANTNVIMGHTFRVLYGNSYITDKIGDVSFEISPLSFFQVNPIQTEKLYSKALAYAGLTGEETVWDLYCGIGTISLFLAKKAKKVYGVEIVPQAIENAKRNAEINGIGNAEFMVGKAEEVLPEVYREGNTEKIHPDVIVVDPPRKGCDEQCLQTIVSMKPQRVVYVSCDPATLARDLKYLCANGYDLCHVQPVDMFPHTVHVESVCLLVNQNAKAKQHVNVGIDAEEYYRIKNS